MTFSDLKNKENRQTINSNLDKLVRLKTQTWLDLGIDIQEQFISDMCLLMIELFEHYADNKLDSFYCYALYNNEYSCNLLGTLWFYGLVYTNKEDMSLDITGDTFKYLMKGGVCH